MYHVSFKRMHIIYAYVHTHFFKFFAYSVFFLDINILVEIKLIQIRIRSFKKRMKR